MIRSSKSIGIIIMRNYIENFWQADGYLLVQNFWNDWELKNDLPWFKLRETSRYFKICMFFTLGNSSIQQLTDREKVQLSLILSERKKGKIKYLGEIFWLYSVAGYIRKIVKILKYRASGFVVVKYHTTKRDSPY